MKLSAAVILLVLASPPVAAMSMEKPSLSEEEIAPCNDLLSARGTRDNASQSNIEFALSNPPFQPLYDRSDVDEFLTSNAKSVAALESGSEARQSAIFGMVFTGTELSDRLIWHRRFTCLLNVRLRQLQGIKPKKAAVAVSGPAPASAAPANSDAGNSPRPGRAVEAHNPANEASDCLEPIDASAYEARHVSSITGAVFRNSCAYPVETRWCVGADRCAKGYDNLATMPANGDRSISYNPPPGGGKATIHWAGCRAGFANRPDFAGTLQYACK